MPDEWLRHAVVVVPDRDNVAVAKQPLKKGQSGRYQGRTIRLTADIPAGHRFALADIPAGQAVIQYGFPFGRSTGIACGERIEPSNVQPIEPTVDLTQAASQARPVDYVPEPQRPTFDGFPRPDGRVGTRNYVLIVPTSLCASHEASRIATLGEQTLLGRDSPGTGTRYPNVDGVVAIPHNRGCGCSEGASLEVVLRTLAGHLRHPNVGAALVIELGCEKTNLAALERFMAGSPHDPLRPAARLSIQTLGGTEAAIRAGLERLPELLQAADRCRRQRVSAAHLVLAGQCGGSDAFSGLTANPAVGVASDWVVRCGGTAIIDEVPEMVGAEHLLIRQAADPRVAGDLLRAIAWYQELARRAGSSALENPSPGNIEGGLLNIVIKSLGAVAKAGTTPIRGLLDYAQPPPGTGLYLMQGPGNDIESNTGLVASGANVLAFTTGRGSTTGQAICPVIKIASTTALYERMRGDMDLNAGVVLDGASTVADVGRRLFDLVLEVASGRVRTWSEQHGHREFGIWPEAGISL